MTDECSQCDTEMIWDDDVLKCPKCGVERVWNEGLCLSETWAMAEIERLQVALQTIRDYPVKPEDRTEDGYPTEVAYDEFAYKRIVDSYRIVAITALDLDPASHDGPE